MELRDPVGNTFNVKFEYQFNKARFSDGISELRVVHQLESIVWIRFSYRRESRFDIKNFDGHLREIEYRIKQQVEEPGNSLDGNHSSLHSSEDKNIVDLVTEDECDNVVSKLQFHKLVWLPDISLAHMTGKRALVGFICVIIFIVLVINLLCSLLDVVYCRSFQDVFSKVLFLSFHLKLRCAFQMVHGRSGRLFGILFVILWQRTLSSLRWWV